MPRPRSAPLLRYCTTSLIRQMFCLHPILMHLTERSTRFITWMICRVIQNLETGGCCLTAASSTEIRYRKYKNVYVDTTGPRSTTSFVRHGLSSNTADPGHRGNIVLSRSILETWVIIKIWKIRNHKSRKFHHHTSRCGREHVLLHRNWSSFDRYEVRAKPV